MRMIIALHFLSLIRKNLPVPRRQIICVLNSVNWEILLFEAGILADNRSPETNSAIEIRFSDNWFLPASVVADWRRQAVDKLVTVRRINYRQEVAVWKPTTHAFPLPGTSSKTTASATSLTYLGNVMNTRAASFYTDHGIATVAPAYEKQSVPGAVLMFCKHCLRYSMGWCPTYQKGRSLYREPYYLQGTDGKRFRLEFDCKNCQMKVYAE